MSIIGLIKNVKNIAKNFARTEKLNPNLGQIESICPYCSFKLNKFPARKVECKNCKKSIYVRTRPYDKKKILIKDYQKDEVEREWAIENNNLDEYLKFKKQSQEEWDNMKNHLQKKRGVSRIPDSDIKWNLYNKERVRHATNCDWGLYRNTTFNMALFFMKENKPDSAILMLCETLYFDVNGPCNNAKVRAKNGYDFFKPEMNFVAPGIIKEIKKCIKAASLNIEDVEQVFLNMQIIDLPFPINKEESWQVIKKHIFQ